MQLCLLWIAVFIILASPDGAKNAKSLMLSKNNFVGGQVPAPLRHWLLALVALEVSLELLGSVNVVLELGANDLLASLILLICARICANVKKVKVKVEREKGDVHLRAVMKYSRASW